MKRHYILPALTIGDQITFADEVQKYTVQAVGMRYVICTKPFNARKTVLYSIIDKDLYVRGVDNCGGLGYETQADCMAALGYLEHGGGELSHRNKPIDFVITKVENKSKWQIQY